MSSRLGPAVHHDGAAQLPAVLVEIVLGFHFDDDRRASKRRRDRRRPGARITGDPHVLRFGHLNRKALERPPAANRPVRFERRVRQAPARELIARPFACAAQCRGPGESRPMDVAQPAECVHHGGPLKPFGLDLGDDRVVDRLLPEEWNRYYERQREGDRCPRHHAIICVRGSSFRRRPLCPPLALDRHESRFRAARRRRPDRDAADHPASAASAGPLPPKHRLAADDVANPRPRDCLVHGRERLELAQRGPGGRRQDDFLRLRLRDRAPPSATRYASSRHHRVPAFDRVGHGPGRTACRTARVDRRRHPMGEQHKRVEGESQMFALDDGRIEAVPPCTSSGIA